MVPKEVGATVQSARSFGASMAFGPWRAFGSERRWTFERVAAFSYAPGRRCREECCDAVNRADFRPVNFPVVISWL